jgi:hypothetical protein
MSLAQARQIFEEIVDPSALLDPGGDSATGCGVIVGEIQK